MALKVKFRNKLHKWVDISIIITIFIFIFIFILILNFFKTPNNNQKISQQYKTIEEFFKQNPNKDQQKNIFSTQTENKVKILFWHNLYPEEEKILAQVITDFQQKYPNIEVLATNKGNWNQIIKSVTNSLPVNKQPHLVVSYPDHVESYLRSNKVVDLSHFMKFDQDYKDNIESKLFYIFKNEEESPSYYLPFLKTTEIMFYNKEILKEIYAECSDLINPEGEFIKPILYWEDIEKICKSLKEKKPQADFVPIISESEANLIILNYRRKIGSNAFPKKYHEAELLLKNPQLLDETIQYFKEHFYNKKYLSTTALNQQNTPLKELFFKQKSAMFISSSRRINNFFRINFKMGLSSIPIIQTDSSSQSENMPKFFSQGSNINLFYSSNRNEMIASWLFLKYLISAEVYQKFFDSKGGLCLTIKDLKDQLEDRYSSIEQGQLSQQNINPKKHLIQIDYEKFILKINENDFFIIPCFEKSFIFRILLQELFIRILSLEMNDKFYNQTKQQLFDEAYQRFKNV
ncbi:MAG: ABC transporter substrate-binding protein [Vigna little leaf phytoplasma]|nr:ABC transporter substrate-binding protein [Vigna little leaf phytoplasma]